MKKPLIISTCLGLLSFLSIALSSPIEAAVDLNTLECNVFTQMATGQRDDRENGLQTEQMIISLNGKNVFSWDDGVYTQDKKHALLSASRIVATTLVGAAIQKGDLKIDALLSDFFPVQLKDAVANFYYGQITIDHLISMSTGMNWDEKSKSDSLISTLAEMLYGEDQSNMNQFAFSRGMEMTPGMKWKYNGGSSVILMAILKKIYRNDHFAQDLLFTPLEMKNSLIEKDMSGNLIGSFYVYMNPEDMQKIGQLYLNDGVYKDQKILSSVWIRKSQVPAMALSRSDTLTKPEDLLEDGVFSQRGFWLNQDVASVKKEYEFKNSPKDMFFAAGEGGQFIIILPTQNMVITTTGHTKDHWRKLDKLVSNAISCFSSKIPVPPTPFEKSENKKLNLAKIKTVNKGYLQSFLAKDICSCHYVSGLSTEACLEKRNLQVDINELNKLVKFFVDESVQTITVKPKFLPVGLSFGKAHSKTAKYFGPSVGCILIP